MGYLLLYFMLHGPVADFIEGSLRQITVFSQIPVAHACNPIYSGGGDQEDHSLKPLKPAWANST
jgi:hypothetical protein